MFFVKYTLALVAFVVAALKLPIVVRTIQQVSDWLMEMAETLFTIPVEYMVLADLADIEGKITFLIFCLILLTIFRTVTNTLKRYIPRKKRPAQ